MAAVGWPRPNLKGSKLSIQPSFARPRHLAQVALLRLLSARVDCCDSIMRGFTACNNLLNLCIYFCNRHILYLELIILKVYRHRSIPLRTRPGENNWASLLASQQISSSSSQLVCPRSHPNYLLRPLLLLAEFRGGKLLHCFCERGVECNLGCAPAKSALSRRSSHLLASRSIERPLRSNSKEKAHIKASLFGT